MFFGAGATSSVTQAAGAPAGGIKASPKTLGGAREEERVDARLHSPLQEVERPRDVDVDEFPPEMSRDMGLVQRRRVEDRPYAGHATPHEGTVRDRADLGRGGGIEDVESDDLVSRVPQRADQCLRWTALPVTRSLMIASRSPARATSRDSIAWTS